MSEPDDLPDSADNAPPEAETALQRALRLKKASIDARPKAPRGGRFQREQAARVATGKSKPWMGR